jgi:hypothetical protein
MVNRSSLSTIIAAICLIFLPLIASAPLPVFASWPESGKSETNGISIVKVLNYSQLMKLTKFQRVQYIAGLRDIVTEVEESQNVSRHSAKDKNDLSAKLEFLRLFIEDAEAIGAAGPRPGTQVTCKINFSDRPGMRAHLSAGLTIKCLSGAKRNCPSGTWVAGSYGGQTVCFDNRRESRARWLANRTKLHLDNSRFIHAAPKSVAIHSHRKKPRRIASTHEAKATQSPEAKQNEINAYEHHDDEAENKKALAFDKRSIDERDVAAKITDKDEATNFTSSTADDLSADGAAVTDVIDRKVDSNGDVHDTRRKIAHFKMLDQAADLNEAADPDATDCTSEVPTSADRPSTCTSDTKLKAINFLAAKGSHHCFAAGNLSHYRNNVIRAKNCQPPREFCLNRVSCRESSGAMAPHAQVTFACKGSNEIICNPYIFNVKADNEPICVPNGPQATKECSDQATKLHTDDRPFFLSTNSPNGVIEGWNEFADEFNHMCFDEGLKDYYCAECQIIKFRLAQLHRLVVKAVSTADTCGKMNKLFPSSTSTSGGTGAETSGGAAPASSSAPAAN